MECLLGTWVRLGRPAIFLILISPEYNVLSRILPTPKYTILQWFRAKTENVELLFYYNRGPGLHIIAFSYYQKAPQKNLQEIHQRI